LNVNGRRREPITINEVTSGLKLNTAQIAQVNDGNKIHKPIGHQQKETSSPLVQPAFMMCNGFAGVNAATEIHFAPPTSIALRPNRVETPATVDSSTQTGKFNAYPLSGFIIAKAILLTIQIHQLTASSL